MEDKPITQPDAATESASTDGTQLQSLSKPERLRSLDALRGFDMLWIIGLAHLVRQLAVCFNQPWLNKVAEQTHHVEWEGFRFYDLIFPMFLFIAGAAIPFSLNAQRKRGLSTGRIYFRISRRLLMLIVLGVVYNGGLTFAGLENTRIASVLGLIGVGCFFASVIVLHFKLKHQLILCGGILLGYWAALMWIPVPEFGAGQLTAEGSFASYFDRLFLPGKLYGTVYDPEGILQAFSSVSLALIGAMAGQWLQRTDRSQWTKALGLFLAGIALVISGLVWGQFYPVIKKLWTGSFVLLASGWSLLLLSLFYLVIDCVGLKKWSIVFIVVGMNPITIYLGAKIIHFEHTSNFLFGGLIRWAADPWQPVLATLGILLLEWLLLYFLYRKKVFLKI